MDVTSIQSGTSLEERAVPTEPAKPTIWARISAVAIPMLKYTAATAFYCIRPSLFFVGAVVGVLFPEEMGQVGTKVQNIWKQQDWAGRTFCATLIVFTFPIFLASCTFLAGAHCGATIMQEAMARGFERQKSAPELV